MMRALVEIGAFFSRQDPAGLGSNKKRAWFNGEMWWRCKASDDDDAACVYEARHKDSQRSEQHNEGGDEEHGECQLNGEVAAIWPL